MSINEIININPKQNKNDFIKLGVDLDKNIHNKSLAEKQFFYEVIGAEFEGNPNLDFIIEGLLMRYEKEEEKKFIIDAVTHISLYSESLSNNISELKNLENPDINIKKAISSLEELEIELKIYLNKKKF